MRISKDNLWIFACSYKRKNGDVIESYVCKACYKYIKVNIYQQDLPCRCPFCNEEKVGMYNNEMIYLWEDKLNDCIRL